MRSNYIQDRPMVGEASIVQQAFGWMFGGLLATAGTSIFAAASPAFQQVIQGSPLVFYGLMIAEFILVMVISASIAKLAKPTAIALFLTYAVLNGLTLSVIFWIYAQEAITAAFVSASLAFGVMAVFGSVTKRDLTGIGSIAFMALIGVIIASVINLFLRSDGLGFIISYAVVAIFTVLTAYDTQRLKRMSQSLPYAGNLGIYGALMLYLDFINIFLALLQIFGRRRD